MEYYRLKAQAFPTPYLGALAGQVLASPYLAVNNLNRDFVGTRGFSIVFRRSGLEGVGRRFPYLKPYLTQALDPACNAFYLNALLLTAGSRVDPHIDRSLRSYCKTIYPPFQVSVLYVRVPEAMAGGELILSLRKRRVGVIRPAVNLLLTFQGDLTHAVNAMTSPGKRLSLVCEQYALEEEELHQIPELTLESRNLKD
ncbi:2OG-Fe(II) oxygenase family protein [Anthocerotibacter panamensis]|uniref:2OG-Fe(II) oxygenase n=1 Tax=Anthocerotibacter panamensis TaxID=2857077 RepID=UPI001C407E9E|nr:2OG-Fe(II) oxygenase [Anthocerotibacter panamensis]